MGIFSEEVREDILTDGRQMGYTNVWDTQMLTSLSFPIILMVLIRSDGLMGKRAECFRDAIGGGLVGIMLGIIAAILTLSTPPTPCIVAGLIIGSIAGYAYGSHVTNADVIKKSIHKWLSSHNAIIARREK